MITEFEIKTALDAAYKEAGLNAYFGNGFRAGVKFAIEHIKKSSTNKKGEAETQRLNQEIDAQFQTIHSQIKSVKKSIKKINKTLDNFDYYDLD